MLSPGRLARRAALLLLVGTAASGLSSRPAPAACPPSAVQFQPNNLDPTLGVRWTAAASKDTFASGEDGSGRARFDLVSGAVHADGLVGIFGSWESHVWARDSYTLVGPPGSPVTVTARLHLGGGGTANSYTDPGGGTPIAGAVALWGVLRSDDGGADSVRYDAFPGRPVTLAHDLAISLIRAAGECFMLTLSANVGMFFGDGSVDGQLSFDVPRGYSVGSCQGFAGSVVVPARVTSWGRVKAAYR